MKVLDLRCERGHQFEGWFSSEDDYQTQRAKRMLTCPVCDSLHVEKSLSAPYVAMKSNRQTEVRPRAVTEHTPQHAAVEPAQAVASSAQVAPSPEQQQALAALHAQWLAYSRAVLATAEDVGSDFADEARKIHEGQAPERLIHGQASMDEVVELLEEGVPVLPMAAQAKEPLQ
ncbi:DUF1178 family protein [Lampropedia aestuarii]|uniref:DUF1178 family protein n=1 Tax=Lampropedia aestuarii TaxID=2562762 RepID=A0A4S5C1U6_9BURK|nr:DUF1178 family protein [Lampropedia aestuarii]MDH5856828.1 DUF1178 family protein [Lampropedia aestuarii]THJ36416.1 DUF1178 family protein [Lampropedia aestuarii]